MRRVKITTIILAIILVTLVAFAGVYVKTQNRMEDKVKDYSFGRELSEERIVEVKVVTGEDKTNSDNLTVENYEIVKNTIEKRLENLRKLFPSVFGAQDYTISLNKENGTIIVELPEDNVTDTYIYYLNASGKVEIKEKDANTVLLNDSMVTNAKYTYTADAEGTYQVFLEVYLTDEGQAKIEEIKNDYAIFVDEVEEIEKTQEEAKKEKDEGEEKTETTTEETGKIAKLTIGGTEYDIEKVEENKIRVIIGSKITNTNVESYIVSATELAMLINSGKMPIQYQIGEEKTVKTDITNMQLIYLAIAVAAILLVTFVILMVRYKSNGFLTSMSYVGFVAILTLLLRYTNVSISIEGIGAILFIFILNLSINQNILESIKENKNVNEAFVETYKNVFSKLVPVIIITLVFCFAGVANLSSFGMIMFWGLALIAVYNAIVTKTLLKLKESK